MRAFMFVWRGRPERKVASGDQHRQRANAQRAQNSRHKCREPAAPKFREPATPENEEDSAETTKLKDL